MEDGVRRCLKVEYRNMEKHFFEFIKRVFFALIFHKPFTQLEARYWSVPFALKRFYFFGDWFLKLSGTPASFCQRFGSRRMSVKRISFLQVLRLLLLVVIFDEPT